MTEDATIYIAIACALGVLAGMAYYVFGVLLLRRSKQPALTDEAGPMPEAAERLAARRRESNAQAAARFVEALGKPDRGPNRRK